MLKSKTHRSRIRGILLKILLVMFCVVLYPSLLQAAVVPGNVWKYAGHSSHITGVAVDDTGNVYSGALDNEVHKIDPDGNTVWVYTGHGAQVSAVAVDTAGNVYSGDENGEVHKIDVNNAPTGGATFGDSLWVFTGYSKAHDLAVDDTGNVYAGGTAKIYKIDSAGNEVWVYGGFSTSVNGVAVDDAGNVYGGESENIMTGDQKFHKIDSSGDSVWESIHAYAINAVTVDNDGYVYFADDNGEVHKRDANNNSVWIYTGHSGSVWTVAVDDTGNVYSGAADNEVHKIDVASALSDGSSFAASVWKYTEHAAPSVAIAIDSEGYIYSGSAGAAEQEVHKIREDIVWTIDTGVSPVGAGEVTLDPQSATYLAGETVTVTATTSLDTMPFSHWSVNPDSGTLSSTTDTEVIYTFADTNITITANFSELDFPVGDGSSGNPFQIETWDHLNNVRDYPDSYFVLNNNIDSTTAGYDTYASATANGGAGWEPIGQLNNEFTGSFEGDSKTISNLYIDRADSQYVGLFGKTENVVIKNIGLLDVDINGKWYVGGLAAENSSGKIENSYVQGTVSSSGSTAGGLVGGLVGYNDNGLIKNSYSAGEMSSTDYYTGGLVGKNYLGTIENSYTTAEVRSSSASNGAGGLVGENRGIINNSYATGKVYGSSGSVSRAGGLVGSNSYGTITNSYATGEVNNSASRVGGLVGENFNSSINNSFYDTYTSGQSVGIGDDNNAQSGNVSGLPAVDLVKQATFTDSSWNFSDTWIIDENRSYPYLRWQTDNYPLADTLAIATAVEPVGAGSVIVSADTQFAGGTVAIEATAAVNYKFDSWTVSPDVGNISAAANALTVYTLADTSVTLTANFLEVFAGGDGTEGNPYQIGDSVALKAIENNMDSYYILVANIDFEGDNFEPIGHGMAEDFVGVFDGDSYVISNMVMNYPDSTAIGLFSTLKGTIKNLGVENVDITANEKAGGIVGNVTSALASVKNCHSSGTVAVTGMYAGGLVGWGATIENSHTEGTVSGLKYVGGLAGILQGPVKNSYSSADVTGNELTGGLIGDVSGNAIENSYSTGDVTGGAGGNTGGLAGKARNITNSFSSGNVDGTTGSNVGGLLGFMDWGEIKNSYSTGDVNGGDKVGGLAGLSENQKFTNCYSIGSVSGSSNVGGLVGQFTGVSVENSYWDVDASGTTVSDSGYGKSTGEMLDQSTFTGWNFSDTWAIETGSYPYLQGVTRTEDILYPPLELTVNITGSGTVAISPQQDTYTYGTQVTLEAKGDTGWALESWSGDTTVSDTTITVRMKDNVSVTAGFKIQRLIDDINRPYSGQVVQQDSALFRIVYRGSAGDTIIVAKSGGGTSRVIGVTDTGVGLKVEKRIDLRVLGVDTGNAVLEISYIRNGTVVDSVTRTVQVGEVVDENEVAVSGVLVNFRGADNDTVSVSGDFEGSDSVVVSAVVKLKDMDKSLGDTVSGATAKLLLEDDSLNSLKDLMDSSVIQIETSENPDTVTLTLYYSDEWVSNLPAGRTEEELRIHRLNESTSVWEIVAGSQVVNTDSKSVSVVVDGFSVFAVMPPPIAGATGLTEFIVGPNPFRASSDERVEFQFNSDSNDVFEVEVYTVTGRRVLKATTTDNNKYKWPGAKKQASGYYIYRVKDRETGQEKTGKLAIIR